MSSNFNTSLIFSSNKTAFQHNLWHYEFWYMYVIFLQLKHVFWHVCNTILRFLMQHISFAHWPWMTLASWNHIDEVINIPMKTKINYNLYFSTSTKNPPELLIIDTCINILNLYPDITTIHDITETIRITVDLFVNTSVAPSTNMD